MSLSEQILKHKYLNNILTQIKRKLSKERENKSCHLPLFIGDMSDFLSESNLRTYST